MKNNLTTLTSAMAATAIDFSLQNPLMIQIQTTCLQPCLMRIQIRRP